MGADSMTRRVRGARVTRAAIIASVMIMRRVGTEHSRAILPRAFASLPCARTAFFYPSVSLFRALIRPLAGLLISFSRYFPQASPDAERDDDDDYPYNCFFVREPVSFRLINAKTGACIIYARMVAAAHSEVTLILWEMFYSARSSSFLRSRFGSCARARASPKCAGWEPDYARSNARARNRPLTFFSFCRRLLPYSMYLSLIDVTYTRPARAPAPVNTTMIIVCR